MPKYKDEPPAVRVYTVCDESKYLIVRNVPSLGCGDELLKLFSTHGQVAECKPMDAEDCDAYTDVYWIKFHQINNARFAKRKIDESVFLGNRLQVSYAPEYESLSDTKDKLEGRRKEVLARLNPRKSTGKPPSVYTPLPRQLIESRIDSSNKEYFLSESMNRTVHLVREKLNKIQSNAEQQEDGSSKRKRVDSRRRI
ncbi:hypothetical protein CASFOL_020904 [Castilleja foliolosa]|uniref:RNA-binding protein 48 n=1 Tax=Castilleja foliolosa TaxID=1961234 RepID=A0ABD3D312_9LAMI